MIHEQFDLDRFWRLFPLGQLRQEARRFVLNRQKQMPQEYPNQQAVGQHMKLMEPGGEIITSPYHMAVVEKLREEATQGSELERVATDVFVFGCGEPADRRITKLGGLPYLPRRARWPHNNDGSPMHFIGQICFSDSRFVVDDLPGDVLLAFSDADPGNGSVESMEFVWSSARETDLIVVADVPDGISLLDPYYGVLHRSYDYVEAEGIFDRYQQGYWLPRIEGTKIGGLPRWIQGEAGLPGRFLCTIGSVNPEYERQYPYVNVERPLSLSDRSGRALMWGDVGSVYLFIDDDGNVHWAEQCY